jgi:O-antigen/teichoic acid export membrane protein
VPFDVITRFWILPGAIASAVFPVFSALQGDRDKSRELYARSLKHVCLLSGLLLTIFVAAAGPLFDTLFGRDFARHSVPVLEVLALGVFAGSIGYIPTYYLQSTGYARQIVFIYALELPPLLLASWLLIGQFGVPGAALAWTLRISTDAALTLTLASIRLRSGLDTYLRGRFPQAVAALAVFALIQWTGPRLVSDPVLAALFGVTTTVIFALFIHRFLLDEDDKMALATLLKAGQKTQPSR